MEASALTSSAIPFVQQNCTNCPKIVESSSSIQNSPKIIESSSSIQNTPKPEEVFLTLVATVRDHTKELSSIKESQRITSNFYNSITKLSTVTRVVMIILMLIPLIQLVLCAAIVYSLGIQEELPSLINWILGGVGVSSLIEIVVMFANSQRIVNRIEQLEKESKE